MRSCCAHPLPENQLLIGHILKATLIQKAPFTGTLANVEELCQNSGECQGGSREYGLVGSPKFAKLRQSSHEGVRMLLEDPGTCPT